MSLTKTVMIGFRADKQLCRRFDAECHRRRICRNTLAKRLFEEFARTLPPILAPLDDEADDRGADE